MVQASIKRENDADGITGGKDYPVIGFMGGCVVIIDDSGKFMPVSFSGVHSEWTVSTDEKEPAPKNAGGKTKA